MRSTPGFLPYLQAQLSEMSVERLNRINDPLGFSLSTLVSQVSQPQDHTVYNLYEPESGVKKRAEISHSTTELGAQSLASGEVAYCILSGDMGTRQDETKALFRVPIVDTTLLAIKLLQAHGLKHVWVMTNSMNHEDIESHLCELSKGQEVKLFQQFESVRLTPDNQLHLENGEPSFYPCGHGDVVSSLQKSGLLKSFLESGGKHIMVVNVNNVLAAPDPALIGQHIVDNSPVTCEVVDKLKTDNSGGVLCNHMGFDQIVEQFRFYTQPDPEMFKWLSTNTYIFKADLDFSTIRWSWHRIKKEFSGKLVVQHERLLQDLTSVFSTQYVGAPREERYMPVKSNEDLKDASRIFRKL